MKRGGVLSPQGSGDAHIYGMYGSYAGPIGESVALFLRNTSIPLGKFLEEGLVQNGSECKQGAAARREGLVATSSCVYTKLDWMQHIVGV